MAFATAEQINAIAVENRKFHHQTTVDWMNRTVADPLFKFLAAEFDKKKDAIMARLADAAKKQYIPTVVTTEIYETVFAKKAGSREDCRYDSARTFTDKPMTVLEYSKQYKFHHTPSDLIPQEFWEYGGKAPDDQNDFYETLQHSDTLRLLENYLGDNFSCHVGRKEVRKTFQYTVYKVELSVQFHLTKRPDWRKEQIEAAVKRYEVRQKAISEDRRMDHWHKLYEEDEKLAEQLESIPWPFTSPHAATVKQIVARRKAIYTEMYPDDGPEYDQDDLNKMDLANRRGF